MSYSTCGNCGQAVANTGGTWVHTNGSVWCRETGGPTAVPTSTTRQSASPRM